MYTNNKVLMCVCIYVQARSDEKKTGPAEVPFFCEWSCEARHAVPVRSTAHVQLGVWGRCKPPSGVRGRAPEAFENNALFHS